MEKIIMIMMFVKFLLGIILGSSLTLLILYIRDKRIKRRKKSTILGISHPIEMRILEMDDCDNQCEYCDSPLRQKCSDIRMFKALAEHFSTYGIKIIP